jgi:hypothetical protein
MFEKHSESEIFGREAKTLISLRWKSPPPNHFTQKYFALERNHKIIITTPRNATHHKSNGS